MSGIINNDHHKAANTNAILFDEIISIEELELKYKNTKVNTKAIPPPK
jgi:hypothetical protein